MNLSDDAKAIVASNLVLAATMLSKLPIEKAVVAVPLNKELLDIYKTTFNNITSENLGLNDLQNHIVASSLTLASVVTKCSPFSNTSSSPKIKKNLMKLYEEYLVILKDPT